MLLLGLQLAQVVDEVEAGHLEPLLGKRDLRRFRLFHDGSFNDGSFVIVGRRWLPYLRRTRLT